MSGLDYEIYRLALQLQKASLPIEGYCRIQLGDGIEFVEKINQLISSRSEDDSDLLAIGDNLDDAVKKQEAALSRAKDTRG